MSLMVGCFNGTRHTECPERSAHTAPHEGGAADPSNMASRAPSAGGRGSSAVRDLQGLPSTVTTLVCTQVEGHLTINCHASSSCKAQHPEVDVFGPRFLCCD